MVSLSHGGATTTLANEPSAEVLVGTVDGVFKVEREHGDSWRARRVGLDGLHIHALLIEPDSGFVFAGAHKGSLFASRDGGKHWTDAAAGLTERDVYCLNATTVAGHVKLYAGTEPARLFESGDLGESWREIASLRAVPNASAWTFPAPPHMAHVKNIAFHPAAPETLYVCVEQGGLLRSDNGGVTWQELHGFDESIAFDLPEGAFPDDVHRLVMSPQHPDRLYLSGGIGISRSDDGGKTWRHLTTPGMRIGYPDALLLHPGREGLLFAAGARSNPRMWRTTHDADSGIARSTDGGENWQTLGHGLPEHLRGNVEAMCMEVWGDGCSLFAGTTDGDIFHSVDEGDTWTRIAWNLPAISKDGHYLRLR